MFTGLRPGEKLDEHLWEDNSLIEPVAEGDVFRVQEPEPPLHGEALNACIRSLERASIVDDPLTLQRLLAEAVPTFVPSLRVEAALRPASPQGVSSRSGPPAAGLTAGQGRLKD